MPRKSVVRLIDRPDMTLDVYRGRKTTMQQLSVSVCVSKSLPLSLSLCLFQTLFLSLFLCLCLSVCLSISLSLPVSINLFSFIVVTLVCVYMCFSVFLCNIIVALNSSAKYPTPGILIQTKLMPPWFYVEINYNPFYDILRPPPLIRAPPCLYQPHPTLYLGASLPLPYPPTKCCVCSFLNK